MTQSTMYVRWVQMGVFTQNGHQSLTTQSIVYARWVQMGIFMHNERRNMMKQSTGVIDTVNITLKDNSGGRRNTNTF